MAGEKLEILIIFSVFVASALLSIENNPLLGLAVLIAMLSAWGGVKRMPKLKKIRIQK